MPQKQANALKKQRQKQKQQQSRPSSFQAHFKHTANQSTFTPNQADRSQGLGQAKSKTIKPPSLLLSSSLFLLQSLYLALLQTQFLLQHFAMGYSYDLSVALHKPTETDGIFTNTDIVSGSVLLQVHKDIEVSNISVKLQGVSTTHIKNVNYDRKKQKNIKTEDTEDYRFLYETLEVYPPASRGFFGLGSKGSSKKQSTKTSKSVSTIKQGKYEYPFQFRIPENTDSLALPPTLIETRNTSDAELENTQTTDISIEYFVKVTVARASHFKANGRVDEKFIFIPSSSLVIDGVNTATNPFSVAKDGIIDIKSPSSPIESASSLEVSSTPQYEIPFTFELKFPKNLPYLVVDESFPGVFVITSKKSPQDLKQSAGSDKIYLKSLKLNLNSKTDIRAESIKAEYLEATTLIQLNDPILLDLSQAQQINSSTPDTYAYQLTIPEDTYKSKLIPGSLYETLKTSNITKYHDLQVFADFTPENKSTILSLDLLVQNIPVIQNVYNPRTRKDINSFLSISQTDPSIRPNEEVKFSQAYSEFGDFVRHKFKKGSNDAYYGSSSTESQQPSKTSQQPPKLPPRPDSFDNSSSHSTPPPSIPPTSQQTSTTPVVTSPPPTATSSSSLSPQQKEAVPTAAKADAPTLPSTSASVSAAIPAPVSKQQQVPTKTTPYEPTVTTDVPKPVPASEPIPETATPNPASYSNSNSNSDSNPVTSLNKESVPAPQPVSAPQSVPAVSTSIPINYYHKKPAPPPPTQSVDTPPIPAKITSPEKSTAVAQPQVSAEVPSPIPSPTTAPALTPVSPASTPIPQTSSSPTLGSVPGAFPGAFGVPTSNKSAEPKKPEYPNEKANYYPNEKAGYSSIQDQTEKKSNIAQPLSVAPAIQPQGNHQLDEEPEHPEFAPPPYEELANPEFSNTRKLDEKRPSGN
ncbi:uncharacterized protein ASCRUDRAFT_95367 [Ascoidea rubescens DSM 1968]|uniref:Arrestin-like N-terminal domain-containing protein n=1 Tax=Ascoidea rubescens DSM 1968 TaxID=1344418 RepID=A0A1D2VPE3_9ASCO|nr:hypothetical protein ASCRUDRAFT_95367 [Ascoidea rubescens DSM 1968]ODV63425.1 hypothetical protein ASCRUDRAFT_95367 [Ascoidea rubescens DSM 1968]